MLEENEEEAMNIISCPAALLRRRKRDGAPHTQRLDPTSRLADYQEACIARYFARRAQDFVIRRVLLTAAPIAVPAHAR
jgi:hypothetical protein